MDKPLFDPKKVIMLRKQQPKLVVDTTFGQCKLTLINKHNEVLGYFSASQETDEQSHYSVNSVAARAGYGKFMYAFAMMTLNEKGKKLMCARDADVRSGAQNVWLSLLQSEGVERENVAFDDFSIKGALSTIEKDAAINGIDKDLFQKMLLKDTKATLENKDVVLGFYNQQIGCETNSLYENLILKSCTLDKNERAMIIKKGLSYFNLVYNNDKELDNHEMSA